MKTIDIVTSNNVIIQYELASILQRVLALIIDLLIWGAYLFLVTLFTEWLMAGVNGFAPEGLTWNDYNPAVEISTGKYLAYLAVAILGVIFMTILFIPVFFYRFLCEYFFAGRTVGKMSVGVRVLKLDGSPPTLSEYFLRSSFMIVDLWASFGSLGFLFSSSSDGNQRLGDMVADTTVIKLNPSVSYSIKDILSIKTSENYAPNYPQVTQLTDDDMLLIKNAIDRTKRFPNKQHKRLIIELAKKSQEILHIEEVPKNKLAFLKTLLQDYIVLTRS